MFPLYVERQRHRVPFINYSILSLLASVFVIELIASRQSDLTTVVTTYGMVPARLLTDPGGDAFTIFTSMFLHGGVVHLVGNLLFLWAFGNAIEDVVGHLRYVLFYFLAGLSAAVTWAVYDSTSTVPLVGAGGAIASTLGAYIVLDPRARVRMFIPVFVWWRIESMPVWIVVGFFFMLTLLGAAANTSGVLEDGSAGFAVVTGLIVGQLLARSTVLLQAHVRAVQDVSESWEYYNDSRQSDGDNG